MNILDENILESQRQLLQKWRVPFRQIGFEVGRKGMTDDEIIRFLLALRRPTLFTIDRHFYKRDLRHARYGLVHLDVQQWKAASFVRRLLRHREFDTHAKRMGAVICTPHTGLAVWRLHAEQEVISIGQTNSIESQPHELQTPTFWPTLCSQGRPEAS